MSNYTNQAKIEAFLGRVLTAGELIMLPLVLDAVDSWIGVQINGVFGPVSESTRYYEGSGKTIQEIDAVQNVSKIALVDALENDVYSYVSDYDYELKPLGSSPKTWIDSRLGRFPMGVSNIAVTGEFTLGNTIPNDIIYLATYLASQGINRQTNMAEGNLKQESIEGYSRTLGEYTVFSESDPIVSNILNKYTKDEVML